jgi:hypothetical protein
MRIFYENLIESVENYYINKSTFENVLYLEDIIKNTTKDIYVQYQKKSKVNISYESSSIDITGIIKCRNHLHFINYYKSTYNNFTALENNKINTIKIKITNVDISGPEPYKIEL